MRYHGELVFDDVKHNELWKGLFDFVKGSQFGSGLSRNSFIEHQRHLYQLLNNGKSFFPFRDIIASFACDYASDADRKEWMTDECDTCPLCGNHDWGCFDGLLPFVHEALDRCEKSTSADEFQKNKKDALEGIQKIRDLPVRSGILKRSQLVLR